MKNQNIHDDQSKSKNIKKEVEQLEHNRKEILTEIKNQSIGNGRNFISLYTDNTQIKKLEKFIDAAEKKFVSSEDIDLVIGFRRDLSKLTALSKVVLSVGSLKSDEFDRLDFVINMVENIEDKACLVRFVEAGNALYQKYYAGSKNPNSAFLKEFGIAEGISSMTIRVTQWLQRYEPPLDALLKNSKALENITGISSPDREKAEKIHEKFKSLAFLFNDTKTKQEENEVSRNIAKDHIKEATKKILPLKSGLLSQIGLSRFFYHKHFNTRVSQLRKEIVKFSEVFDQTHTSQQLHHIDTSIQFMVEALDVKISFILNKVVTEKIATVNIKNLDVLLKNLTKTLEIRKELKIHETKNNKALHAATENIFNNITSAISQIEAQGNTKKTSEKQEKIKKLITHCQKELLIEKGFNQENIAKEKKAHQSHSLNTIPEKNISNQEIKNLHNKYIQLTIQQKVDNTSNLKEVKALLDETKRMIEKYPEANSLIDFKRNIESRFPSLKENIKNQSQQDPLIKKETQKPLLSVKERKQIASELEKPRAHTR